METKSKPVAKPVAPVTVKEPTYLKKVIVTQDLDGTWTCNIKCSDPDYPFMIPELKRVERVVRVAQRAHMQQFNMDRDSAKIGVKVKDEEPKVELVVVGHDDTGAKILMPKDTPKQ